jgi:hypothetical protein
VAYPVARRWPQLPSRKLARELGAPRPRALELALLERPLGVLHQGALASQQHLATTVQAPCDRARGRSGDVRRVVEPRVERSCVGPLLLGQVVQPVSQPRVLGRARLHRGAAILLGGLHR